MKEDDFYERIRQLSEEFGVESEECFGSFVIGGYPPKKVQGKASKKNSQETRRRSTRSKKP
jgi:hypothetical protein